MKIKKVEIMQYEPYINEEQIKQGLKDRACIKKYAYIRHDKDTYTKEDEEKNCKHKAGTLKSPHWHIMLQFSDSQDTKYIAKWFDVEEQYVQKSVSGNYNSILKYLVHENATGKVRYDANLVVANFDYVAFIEAGDKSARQVEIVKLIENGTIREYNYMEYMTTFEYHKYKSLINDAFEYRRDKLANKSDRELDVVYVQGASGTGKTSFAKWLCKQKGYSHFISSTGDDILDGYKGQDCIILDDIRSTTMRFSDFVKMIDNNTNSLVKSRYYNKSMTECKLLIITTVYSIEKFYKLFEEDDEPRLQFERRCKILIKLGEEYFTAYQFNRATCKYEYTADYKNPVQALIQKSIEEKKNIEQLNNFFDYKNVERDYEKEFEKIKAIFGEKDLSVGTTVPTEDNNNDDDGVPDFSSMGM